VLGGNLKSGLTELTICCRRKKVGKRERLIPDVRFSLQTRIILGQGVEKNEEFHT